MIRLDKVGFVVAFLIVAGLAADASACGRCGLFGRKCRYHAPVYYKPAYVAPVASYSTNYVFNNVFPSPYLLAPQGQSVYGVQQASYSDSSALYMDRAARFTDRAFDLAQTGQQLYAEGSTLALQVTDAIDRRHTNAQIAALAMEANRGTVQQTFQVQIQDGKMSIVQPQYAAPQQQQGPQQLVQAMSCASCHDGRGTKGAPKHIILDGSVGIDQPTLELASTAVIAGRMPPAGNLTPAQKTVVITSLHSLLARPRNEPPAEPEPPLPPAPQPPADNNFGKPEPGGLQ